jgi:two-component sensor histidine kinase
MNRALFVILFILSLVACKAPSYGQDYLTLHYTKENGLPSNNIYQLYTDSKGFVWFGTNKGIVRYNGIKFDIFTTFDGLPDNEILFFKEDYEGRLWMGTFNGELCYYKNDSFHTAANTPFLKLPFKARSLIHNITIEKDSSVSFDFYNQLVFINIKHNKCKLISLENKQARWREYGDLIYLKKNAPNEYKVVCNDYDLLVDSSGNVMSEKKSENNKYVYFNQIQDQTYIVNGSYILFNGKDTVKPSAKNIINTTSAFPDGIYHLYNDGKRMFMMTRSALYLYDSLLLFKGQISSFGQGIGGNYWIATADDGIYVLNKNFFESKIFKNAYKNDIRFSHYVGGKGLFYATVNDLYSLANNKIFPVFNFADKKLDKTSEVVFSMNNKARLYSFFGDNAMVVDNYSNGHAVRNYKVENAYGNYKSIIGIEEKYYLQTRNAICGVNFDSIRNGKLSSECVTPQTERIYCMAKHPDNSIWYSTLNNIYRISNEVPVILPQFKNISFKYFNFFGKYLIGYTHDNNLLVCDNISGKIDIDSVAGQNCIWDKFYKLDTNHILLSTNNLYRLLTLGSAHSYSISVIEDPFLPLEAESVCSDGTNCYFFKNESVTSLRIQNFLLKATPPNLFFTLLKTNKKTYAIERKVQITYSESRNLSVLFSAISPNGENISYQYSFSKGGEDNWRDVNGEEINIVNSGFGEYVVKMRAKSLSSNYSEYIVFTLEILRPFWATWWFALLAVLVVTAAILLVIRRKINATLIETEKEHQAQVKFMKSEYKALNALMNPHFIFNTLNNVQGLINRNDKMAANEYLRIFADLVRQNMHNVSKELIPLQKELDLVANYLLLEKLRFRELLNYSIEIDDDIDLSDIMISPLLIQPLVENSLKHGILPMESPDGYIKIHVYEQDNSLVIEVKDNGVGMANSAKKASSTHESFGLENIKKRIEQLSIIQNKNISFNIGEIRDTSNILQWTVVTIKMPLSD